MLQRVSQGLLDVLTSLPSGGKEEGEGEGNGGRCWNMTVCSEEGGIGQQGSTQHFKDDLRVLDFSYVVDESGRYD